MKQAFTWVSLAVVIVFVLSIITFEEALILLLFTLAMIFSSEE